LSSTPCTKPALIHRRWETDNTAVQVQMAILEDREVEGGAIQDQVTTVTSRVLNTEPETLAVEVELDNEEPEQEDLEEATSGPEQVSEVFLGTCSEQETIQGTDTADTTEDTPTMERTETVADLDPDSPVVERLEDPEAEAPVEGPQQGRGQLQGSGEQREDKGVQVNVQNNSRSTKLVPKHIDKHFTYVPICDYRLYKYLTILFIT